MKTMNDYTIETHEELLNDIKLLMVEFYKIVNGDTTNSHNEKLNFPAINVNVYFPDKLSQEVA